MNLASDGGVDLDYRKHRLVLPEYQDRLRIRSFRRLSTSPACAPHARRTSGSRRHAHDAYACFDYAASAPYVEIDMNPAVEPAGGDAPNAGVFLSPHKFRADRVQRRALLNERLYSRQLPPSVAVGGTVDYVSPQDQDFIVDIELVTSRHARRAADDDGGPRDGPEAEGRCRANPGARTRNRPPRNAALVHKRAHRDPRKS